jgi:hypothetical protein
VSIEGKRYDPVSLEIDADHVAAFAWAIGADPGEGVPPTYAAVYCLGATAPQLFGDKDAAIDFGRLLHAEQEFSWARHPQVGDRVTTQATVTSDQSRRGIRFVTLEADSKDEAGEQLCHSRALFVIRSAD